MLFDWPSPIGRSSAAKAKISQKWDLSPRLNACKSKFRYSEARKYSRNTGELVFFSDTLSPRNSGVARITPKRENMERFYRLLKHPKTSPLVHPGRGDHTRTYARAYLKNLKNIFIYLFVYRLNLLARSDFYTWKSFSLIPVITTTVTKSKAEIK